MAQLAGIEIEFPSSSELLPDRDDVLVKTITDRDALLTAGESSSLFVVHLSSADVSIRLSSSAVDGAWARIENANSNFAGP